MSVAHVVVYRGRRKIDVASSWTDERREKFLLARAAELPLSLDQGVLPEATGNDSPASVLELMAAVCHVEGAEAAFSDWTRFRTGDEVPGAKEAAWFLLGYDVCGKFSVSALMNCGYSSAERSALPAAWGLLLNRHHLFERLEHAVLFARQANDIVTEHAPFLPFALYVRVPA